MMGKAPGASLWLSAIPIEQYYGLALHKTKFTNASVCLSYGWIPAHLPSVSHALF